MAEQRYQAVMAVISDGLLISQVAEKVGVSRQTLHSWLAHYEAEGLDGFGEPVAPAEELSAPDARTIPLARAGWSVIGFCACGLRLRRG